MRSTVSMKKLQQILLPWIIIILCLVILFHVYHHNNGKYSESDKGDPLPSNLHPTVEANKNRLIERAAKKNIDVVITEEVRSFKEQNRLYEQGRTRKGNIVTYAKGGESYHNYGLAIDFALENDTGKIIWNIQYDGNGNNQSDWYEVAAIAKELGFEWGGDWNNFKDYPHLQMTFGLSINQLQQGVRPKVD